MVRWFSIGQLISTGLKAVIASIFGGFADRREAQAALQSSRSLRYEDLSQDGDEDGYWFNYISDLGDGFNPTYTMAQLVSRDLSLQGATAGGALRTKRGHLLIMGGDQVYPTPEKIEYLNRLQGPYAAAFPHRDRHASGQEKSPKLLAIPGNHDWYDGLTNFIRLFTQGRHIGIWKTAQERSYFAARLPYNYWLIGIDIQLHSDIDKPQLDYFREVFAEIAQYDDQKIILCTAEPAWVYQSNYANNSSYEKLRFFINNVLRSGEKEVDLKVILTGDLHHYSRFQEVNGGSKGGGSKGALELITAGGGGSFLHPTHFLKEECQLYEGDGKKETFKLKKIFPSKRESRRLSWHNLKFAFLNPIFSLTLGVVYFIVTWLMQNSSLAMSNGIEVALWEQLSDLNYWAGLHLFVRSLFYTPAALFMLLIALVGIVAFTDVASGKGRWNYISGGLHAVLHFAAIYSNFYLATQYIPSIGGYFMWAYLLETLTLGTLFAGSIFGGYLIFSTLSWFGNHPNESFAAIRLEGYKNFLRLHISKEGVLTIYPIGVRKVPKRWIETGAGQGPQYQPLKGKIETTLIEDPIII